MSQYYREKLSAERLEQVYVIAPPRIQQYLKAEVDHAAGLISEGDAVLELGCGYGRLIPFLAGKAESVTGIDNSPENLSYARTYLSDVPSYELALMDASRLGFKTGRFDLVFCLQNGISAFQIEPDILIREALRVTRDSGMAVFTSYSDKIWDARLEWFELQSEAGLLGEIDYDRTGDGVIVCKDGFQATTFSMGQFVSLSRRLGISATVSEIDDSCVVCELTKNPNR